jgi:glutaredoxin 3
MPADVLVYTTDVCPYCVQAKALLRKKHAAFTEIDVRDRPELRRWLIEASSQRTVPQIFINGRSVGGFSDIAKLDRDGKLDGLLAVDSAPTDPLTRR